MTAIAALTVSRFVHYLALSLLFGGALFPLYGFAHQTPETDRHLRFFRPLLLSAAMLGFASGIAWFLLTTMAPIADTIGAVSSMHLNTGLGAAWAVRLILAAALIALLLPPKASRWRSYVILIGAFFLLASLAWTGHAGTSTPAAAPLRAFHLLASGVWIGALFVFAALVLPASSRFDAAELRKLHDALEHFSGVGSAVVATLVITGVLLLGLPNTSRAYAIVLVVKLTMFGAMLLLAAANRFWLTPRLSAALGGSAGLAQAVGALRLSLLVETALGTLVLAAVAWLEALAPMSAA